AANAEPFPYPPPSLQPPSQHPPTTSIAPNADVLNNGNHVPTVTFAPIIDQVRKWLVKYDGGRDPLAFAERLEELADVYALNVDLLPKTMPELLSGTALQWYRNNNEHWSTWHSFKRDFLNFFLPAQYFERLEDDIRQRRQRPREKFKDYVIAIQNLMRRAAYSNEQRLERIFRNSHADYLLYIKRRDFNTLPELLALAEEYEGIQESRRRAPETARREIVRHVGDDTIMSPPQPRQAFQQRPPPRMDQHHREAPEYSAGQPIILSQERGRLYALISLGGAPAEAVIDTGASRSFVSASVAEQLEQKKEAPYKRRRSARENINRIEHEDLNHEDEAARIRDFLAEELQKFETISGVATVGEHRIIMTDERPIKQRYFPRNPAMQSVIDTEIDELLKKGCIEPSRSPHSAPIVLARKKNGKWRLCVDYRQLNARSVPDAYPLPRIQHILDKLRQAKYISSLDLKNGYWQIPLEPKSRPYTAFTVPGRGLFQWRVMPFGLHSAPATFQRALDQVIGPEMEPYAFAYLDDIIVIGSTFDEHVEHLRAVLRRLQRAIVCINSEKCDFFKRELRYLGHVISDKGIHTDPDKVAAIKELKPPTNVKEVRRYLGIASWYRRFVPDFAALSQPLTALLKKGKHWRHTGELSNRKRST
ncbi:uncharacterized protein LOC118754970, partial [Rhagoletis pomonella]|uniref:uncharacterized protein LOC118754970 n=1 Tax=Rhagoletis pomonella TaxID=28610 RepID=UPI0017844CF6